jgi:hypothetical protein
MLDVETKEMIELDTVAGKETFELSDVEMETLRRAALERSLPYDQTRRAYSREELSRYGMVREGYTRQELRDLGIGPQEVSCFDDLAQAAQELLPVETPFGSGIKKWQLPIDMMPMRVSQTLFPANSVVEPHVHPANSPDAPGGGLRIVTKGKIFYKGREYGPGDWFFVPNGVAYSFTTDPAGPTTVMYKYAFFGFEQGNRFSHPSAVAEGIDR